jgi:hypothetical protein
MLAEEVALPHTQVASGGNSNAVMQERASDGLERLSTAQPERQIWAQEPEIRPNHSNAQHPS